MTFGIIVAAGGEGQRAGTDKLWEELLGKPLLSYTLTAAAATAPAMVVVAAPPARHEDIRRLWDELGGEAFPLGLVPGGSSRQESVGHALAAMGEVDVVVVQDGARPLCTAALLVAAAQLAKEHGAVTAAVPVADSVAFLEEDGALAYREREGLFLVQTPQAFGTGLLRQAHVRASKEGWAADDDAQLVRQCGHKVALLLGARENIKVTYAVDFAVAAALLGLQAGGEAAQRSPAPEAGNQPPLPGGRDGDSKFGTTRKQDGQES